MKIQSSNNKLLFNPDSISLNKKSTIDQPSFEKALDQAPKDSFVRNFFSPTEYAQIELDIPTLSKI